MAQKHGSGRRSACPSLVPALTRGMVASCLIAAGATGDGGHTSNRQSVFDMPALQRGHQELAGRMRTAMQAGDPAAMESVCRKGIELLPRNPVWRYNLACALARQQKTGEALAVLEKAIALGFRDADKIAGDDDLAPLRESEQFQLLVARARETAGQPVKGEVTKKPLPVINRRALVSETNTIWNFDLGHFLVLFELPEKPESQVVAAGLGPAGELVNRWYLEGTAAGNHGDLYDNRDDGHSTIDLAALPQVTRVEYSAEARKRNVNWGLSNFLFPGCVVVGNSSSARTGDAFWRSVARSAITDGQSVALLTRHYTDNHLYIYPSHQDYRREHGDTFPANTPFMLIPKGSSFVDQPWLRTSFLVLAAMRPEVKEKLRRNHLLIPTLQMILRSGRLADPQDYLEGTRHRAVMPPEVEDQVSLVKLAQSITADRTPPLARLRLAGEETMRAGRDFFDIRNNEMLFDTPFAVARVMRGMPYTRRYRLSAAGSMDLNDLPLSFHWRIIQGNPEKVRIRPLAEDYSEVEIELDYHDRFTLCPENEITSTRVDIGLFAHNGHYYSAPAIASFFYLGNEKRLYHSGGRILSVDYASARGRYVDPMVSLPRNWRDDYRYSPQGQLLGWMRLDRSGVRDYTADGFRVESKDRQGRPVTARQVDYVVRAGSGPGGQPELVEVDGDRRVYYRYRDANDLTGTITNREPPSPDR